MKYLSILLIFVLLAILAALLHLDPLLVFVVAALGVIPLAGLLGKATEELAVYAGPGAGAFLNATFGNAAELIITVVAIREGLLELVKASITGSILGNILLVLGFSVLLGGLKNGVQRFDRRAAGTSAAMLAIAVIGLVIPAIFSHAIEVKSHDAVEYLSISVAVVLMAVYILSLLFSFLARRRQAGQALPGEEPLPAKAEWSLRKALLVLTISTGFMVWLSEILVGAVEHVIVSLGLTEFFLGVIVVPIIGNVAEHLVGVQVAIKNKMDLSVGISVGSSLQIALFVAPLLVFVSLLMGRPMSLIFNPFELAALVAAVSIASLISLDGESNWLEGAQLLAVYLIVALAFFYLPA